MSISTTIETKGVTELRKVEYGGKFMHYEIYVEGDFCARSKDVKTARKLFKEFCY